MPSDLLTPSDRALLDRLRFSPRRRIEGLLSGPHASRQHGGGIEFHDYRAYVPGDALGDVDWKASARTVRPLVRRTEHDTQLRATILIDASASMAYAGPGRAARGPRLALARWLRSLVLQDEPTNPSPPGSPPVSPALAPGSKLHLACQVAAGLGRLLVTQRDAAGLAIARGGLAQHVPARPTHRHWAEAVDGLRRVEPAAEAGLADAIDTLGRRLTRRGLVIVISDLLEPPAPIVKAARRVTARGHEMIVIQVQHADEIELPLIGEVEFVDSETGQRVRADADELRNAHRAAARHAVDQWRARLAGLGVDHTLVRTDRPWTDTLSAYLRARDATR